MTFLTKAMGMFSALGPALVLQGRLLAADAVPVLELESVWSPSRAVAEAVPGGNASRQLARQTFDGPVRKRIAHWLDVTGDRRANVPLATSQLVRAADVRGETFLSAVENFYALGNADVGVLIAAGDGSVRVVSLYHFKTGVEWVGTSPSATDDFLGTLTFAGPEHGGTVWPLGNAKSVKLAREKDGLTFHATWETPLNFAGGPAAASAAISLTPDSPLLKFDLSIDRMPAKLGLRSVQFPVLANVGYRGRTDAIAGTLGLSRLIRGVDKPIDDHLWAEQFRVLTLGPSSLYVAAYDPNHEQKYYHFEAGKELSLRAAGTDPTALGKPWTLAYPIYIGPIAGDWFDAAQLYREWGLKQPWAKRGPVRGWTGPGREMAKVMVWPQTLGPSGPNTEKTVGLLQQIAKKMGARTGAHYYQWWGTGSDAFAPRMLHGDMRPGLPAAWRQLNAEGIDVMPYFNVLYWRMNPPKGEPKIEPDTAGAIAAACMPAPGAEGDDVAGEVFKNAGDRYLVNPATLAMMPECRLTEFWQKYNVDIAKIIVDAGCTMAYLDQGGVPPRSPCYNPAHGHTPGGSAQWAKGTHKLCERIKFEGGKEIALSSEGAYEGYMDVVETHFMHYWTWLAPRDVLCPLFEAVYHDHSLFMSAVKTRNDPVAYAIDTGTRLLYGNQFRFDFNTAGDPQFETQVAFVGKMSRLRELGAAWLVDGRMIRPPVLAEAPPKVTCDWLEKTDKETKQISITQRLKYPQLERSSFVDADGGEATFVVNFGKTDGTLKLVAPAGTKKAIVTGNDGKAKSINATSASVHIPVPAFDGVMVRFEN